MSTEEEEEEERLWRSSEDDDVDDIEVAGQRPNLRALGSTKEGRGAIPHRVSFPLRENRKKRSLRRKKGRAACGHMYLVIAALSSFSMMMCLRCRRHLR